jgi:hypothetical protein
MTKSIILATGNIPVEEYSGYLFLKTFGNKVKHYLIQNSDLNVRGQWHTIVPPATVGWSTIKQIKILKEMPVGLQHLQFQPLIGPKTYLGLPNPHYEAQVIYRNAILKWLPVLLAKSNWENIVLTGLDLDECGDIVDVAFNLTVDNNGDRKVRKTFQRATIR